MLDQTKASPNKEAFDENRNLPSTKLDTTDAPVSDANPGGPTPTEDASSGIAPIAGYIPKDAPNLSHPTPPPDQPLASGEANVDTEMQDQPTEEPTPIASEDTIAPVESTEPQAESAFADAKPEEALLNGVEQSTEPLPESDSNAEVNGDAKPIITSTESTQESAQSGLVRPREDDGDDEPAAKRTKVDEPQSAPKEASAAPTAIPAADPQPVVKSAPESTPRVETAIPSTEKSVAAEKPTPAPAPAPVHPASRSTARYPTSGMTAAQKAFLIEKLKNTKKTKHAIFFLTPVDPVALKIPTYPDVIKRPMDLGTVESKLKNDQYASVQAFADDLQLIVDNAAKFNGPQHAVTHAGNNMLAYTNNFMGKVPQPGQASKPTKPSTKYSPAPPKAKAAPHREPRPQPPPVAKERSNASEAFALQSDGMPTIRRDSQIQRPARAIKPPTKHEVTYPKPKRREHLLELKFAEHALEQIRSPRYAQLNHVFLMPVDPVALNIPHYRNIIKKPMDLGTMTQKLKQGQYGKAAELKADFDLMIDNCIHFNPPGNPVRDLGIQLKREFDRIWREKEKWEQANRPRSERASSVSGEESAGEESEEEEEPQDEAQATIRALSQKLAEMQNQLAGLGQGKAPKSKKAKEIAKVSSKKKALSSAVSRPVKHVPAPKSKPKKAKPVTYEEKQEISSAVEKMDGPQIERLTQIITENCEKYRNMGDEMELEIDDLPDDVQRLLLKHVRGIFGNPNRGSSVRAPSPDDIAAADDDDFEPSHRSRGGGGGGGDAKRKKHKPMNKQDQQDSINNLRNQLAAFKGGAPPAGSASPTGVSHAAAHQGGEDDSSGDDSEESEEE
jgi:bromodomain-containing factor 1